MPSSALDARADGAANLWWRRLPGLVGRFSPFARELIIDSRYLLAWPRAAALAPAAALALGLLIGLAHPGGLYSGSLLVLILLTLVSASGCTAGCWFLVAFLPADVLLRPGSWAAELSKAGLVVADLVLALLLVMISATAPRAAAQLTQWWTGRVGARTAGPGAARPVAGDVLMRRQLISAAFTQALLVWSWAQAAPTLIRPAYVWAGGVPDRGVVSPVQDNVLALVLVAALGGAGRAFLEWRSRQPGAADGRADWESRLGEAPSGGRVYPLWARLGFRICLGVLLCAGLIGSPLQALLLGLALTIGVAAQRWVGRRAGWMNRVLMLPTALRLAAVMLCVFVIGLVILEPVFMGMSVATARTVSLVPVLAATAIGFLFAAIALPEQD